LVEGDSAGKDEVMAAPGWLKTPPKVRQLQRTLYRKAKENKGWRAWSLYGDLARHDVLETALRAVVRNGGVAGVDGVTVEQVKGEREVFLEALQRQLREKSYRPSPVLRGWVPKDDGKQRPLGIPTVKDRIVQMALLLLLQPIFEADFHDHSYGYRPGKSAQQALDAIREAIRQGYHEVIDADLSGYFDTINHAALLKLVARRVSDGSVLKLVKQFLQAPIVERSGGKQRITPNKTGTPQGGVISPLLANLYLDSLDHQANEPKTKAKMVRAAVPAGPCARATPTAGKISAGKRSEVESNQDSNARRASGPLSFPWFRGELAAKRGHDPALCARGAEWQKPDRAAEQRARGVKPLDALGKLCGESAPAQCHPARMGRLLPLRPLYACASAHAELDAGKTAHVVVAEI
jgi:hypothetical protein